MSCHTSFKGHFGLDMLIGVYHLFILSQKYWLEQEKGTFKHTATVSAFSFDIASNVYDHILSFSLIFFFFRDGNLALTESGEQRGHAFSFYQFLRFASALSPFTDFDVHNVVVDVNESRMKCQNLHTLHMMTL